MEGAVSVPPDSYQEKRANPPIPNGGFLPQFANDTQLLAADYDSLARSRSLNLANSKC